MRKYGFNRQTHCVVGEPTRADVIKLHVKAASMENIKNAVKYIKTAKICHSYLPLTYWAFDKEENEYKLTGIRYYGSGLHYAKAELISRKES